MDLKANMDEKSLTLRKTQLEIHDYVSQSKPPKLSPHCQMCNEWKCGCMFLLFSCYNVSYIWQEWSYLNLLDIEVFVSLSTDSVKNTDCRLRSDSPRL